MFIMGYLVVMLALLTILFCIFLAFKEIVDGVSEMEEAINESERNHTEFNSFVGDKKKSKA